MVKHIDLKDGIVSKNWMSAEAYMQRNKKYPSGANRASKERRMMNVNWRGICIICNRKFNEVSQQKIELVLKEHVEKEHPPSKEISRRY